MDKEFSKTQVVGFFAGPLLAISLAIFMAPPSGLTHNSWMIFVLLIWMGIWWLSEAVPLSVTSFLPLVWCPLTQSLGVREIASRYADPVIYMFLGGFIISHAMQRWSLHKRLALSITRFMGAKPKRIIFGFMVASGFLSMWMSNTAVAVMMMPIGAQVAEIVVANAYAPGEKPNFAIALLLGIAYGSSIGGSATLIGSPPNIFLASHFMDSFGRSIGFDQWFAVGLPVIVVLFPLTWWLLSSVFFPTNEGSMAAAHSVLEQEYHRLGKITKQEIWVLVVFVLVAVMWFGARYINAMVGFKLLNNTTAALLGASLFFVIPVNFKQGEFLLDRTWAKHVDWNLIILFGGGLSLAYAMEKTGLAVWIGSHLNAVSGSHMFLAALAVTTLTVAMTQFTSNTATAAILIPIGSAMATSVNVDPILVCLPVAFGATYAFMTPVATPPNAIVFSAGYISVKDMLRAGTGLTIVSILTISGVIYVVAPLVFGG